MGSTERAVIPRKFLLHKEENKIFLRTKDVAKARCGRLWIRRSISRRGSFDLIGKKLPCHFLKRASVTNLLYTYTCVLNVIVSG